MGRGMGGSPKERNICVRDAAGAGGRGAPNHDYI